MEFPILLGGVATLIGATLGWFVKGGFGKLALWCAVVSLAFGAIVNLILAGPPASLSANYLATAAFYFLWPCLLFLFLPSLVAAGLVFFIKSRRKRE